MPKRMCPFPFDLEPQNKLHVSEKEAFTTMDFEMKKIHDKTLAMLFKGAKFAPDITTSCENRLHSQTAVGTCDKKRYKQMVLNNQCQLERGVAPDSSITSTPQSSSVCQLCSFPNITASVSCWVCDQRVCIECSRVCVQCGSDVCKSCTQEVFHYGDHCLCRYCS